MSEVKAPESAEVSLSVQALIDRLREEGVASGQDQAARIIADAERKAHAILKGAEVLFEPKAVRITPPLTISKEEIIKGCAIIIDILNSIQKK